MKLLTVLIFSITAQLASAAGEITYQWPSVNGLAINNACATPTTFKSLTPVKYCTEVKVTRFACRTGEAEICRKLKDGQNAWPGEIVREEAKCIAYGSSHTEVSRKVVSSECLESSVNEAEGWVCHKWGTKETFVGTTFDVPTYKDYGGEVGQIYDGSKKFTVPNCNK